MINLITLDNFNEIYIELIKTVQLNGHHVTPRGMGVTEMICTSFCLSDVNRSLLTLKERHMAYKFNVAEKLCYVSGNSGEEILPKYAKNIANFINPETKLFDGSYGPRIHSQLKWIIDLLKSDKDTRQAVITINNFHDDMHKSLDIPCTVMLQFFIRDDKLHCIVYMRSNDLYWGTPYDVSQFTFIQEVIANCVGVKTGTYTHIAGSLHIYDRDKESFDRILKDQSVNDKKQLKLDCNNIEEIIENAKDTLNEMSSLYPYFYDCFKTLYGDKSK